MFIIDDLLAVPVRGLMFVLAKINEAAQRELEAEELATMTDLTALYLALDKGTITEEEFAAREQELLGRLDRLRAKDKSDARRSARS